MYKMEAIVAFALGTLLLGAAVWFLFDHRSDIAIRLIASPFLGAGAIFGLLLPATRLWPCTSDTHVIVGDSGIRFPNGYVPFSSVTHVAAAFGRTRKSYNFFPAGQDFRGQIIVKDTRARSFHVRSGPGIFTTFGKDIGEHATVSLLEKWRKIQKATFDHRLARTEDALHRQGYFLYDGKRFLEDGTVHFGRFIGLLSSARKSLSDARCIEIPAVSRLGGESSKIEISLVEDEDVFLYLARKSLGLPIAI